MKRKLKYLMIPVVLLLSLQATSGAQNVSISTDLVSYLNFATMNVEASYPISRCWSVNAGVRYNPFTFDLGEGKEDARCRRKILALARVLGLVACRQIAVSGI